MGVVVAILSAQSLVSAREGATSYLVQPGDTLSSIATSTGQSVSSLASQNNIKDPNAIVAGQTLAVAPSATATSVSGTSSATGQYTVKAGDTLWNIAQANGVSVDDLTQANNLSNADQLSPGQVLHLPVVAGVQRSATATATPSAAPARAASPTPTAQSSSGSALLQKVASAAQSVGGSRVHVGIAATNLNTGEKVSWHADDEFPSASVMKLPILVELERQIAAGQVSWTPNLRSEVTSMISVSDNSAANEIADKIHPQSVNASMSKIGLTGTQFYNLFNDAPGSHGPGENQTTAANMARLLELIANNQIVSAQASADIRGLLAENTDRSKLVRLLPTDAQVAHKSGWYDGVANDVGIVTVSRVPTRWVIAVFSEKLPDAETGNQLIATVSRAIYDAWAK